MVGPICRLVAVEINESRYSNYIPSFHSFDDTVFKYSICSSLKILMVIGLIVLCDLIRIVVQNFVCLPLCKSFMFSI